MAESRAGVGRIYEIMQERLPKFTNPPVVEVVLGAQFKPLPNFRNAHLGAFWKTLASDWSATTDAGPLTLQTESFGDVRFESPQFRFSVGANVNMRVKIHNKEGDKMIQVQNGRLHYNWLTTEAKRKYPSYPILRPEFDAVLEDFTEFISHEELGAVELDQWEVTYVNHIFEGTVWNDPADWPALLAPLLGRPNEVPTGRFENCSGAWRFEITPEQGRMHIELGYGSERKERPRQLLILKITARGPIVQHGLDLDQGLNLGHETIVKTFKAITSDAAHRYWGLVDGTD